MPKAQPQSNTVVMLAALLPAIAKQSQAIASNTNGGLGPRLLWLLRRV